MPIKPTVINLLFKGDSKPLPQEDEYVREFEIRGLSAITVPVLKFKFINLPHLIHLLQKPYNSSKGLIITSPRVAQATNKALQLVDETTRRRIISSFSPELVFVVGEKTASECIEMGLECNLESASSGNSKNLASFIRTTVVDHVSLIYPKGSLANNFLEEELAGREQRNIGIESVIVYETKQADNLLETIAEELEKFKTAQEVTTQRIILNATFFSPSGVETFASFGGVQLVTRLRDLFQSTDIEIVISSIGQTTKAAIERNNFQCFCVAEKPNASSLVNSVIQQLNKLIN